MLDWIMKNKEWVFSGIGVAVLGAFGRWLWSKKGKGKGQNEAAGTGIGISVQQSNVNGDNVIGDKITKG